tara:strand:- start:61 stop:549 length:489 start_codon:yes stop_codon:yes gene_type:complete
MIDKIETTFDFRKLENKIDGIINDVVDDAKRLFRTATRENLKSGKIRKLRPFSIEMRKKGQYWANRKENPPNPIDKPLVWTKSLLNSIKVVDDGVEMNRYGLNHQEGFFIRSGLSNVRRVVRPRKFFALNPETKNLASTKYGKEYKKFIDQMYKKIHKALKK